MKTLSTIAITIIGIFILLFGAIWMITAPITKPANAFFKAWSTGQPQLSYVHLSSGFTQSTSAAQLHKFMTDQRLTQGVTPSWSKRSVVNSTGTLTGELTRADGTVIPATVTLVKENDAWKILGLNLTIPQLTSTNSYASNTSTSNQYNGNQAWTRTSDDGAETTDDTNIATSIGALIAPANDAL